MFKLDMQTCKIADLNTFSEKHGPESMPAASIKFTCTMGNDVLDMFDDELRKTLFKRKPVDEKDLADQGMDDSYLSQLRFPYLQKTLIWDCKSAGYRVEIDYGLEATKNIILINAEINKFKFSPKDGGSVDLEFTVCGHPSGEEVGKLYELQQASVDLTLEPPSAEKLAQMEIDAARGEEEDEDKAA